MTLRWTVFPLHPETPEEGAELTDLFVGREELLRAMQERLRQAAAAEGLPLAERGRTYNSRRAQELFKWADGQGRGDDFRQGVYRAMFVEGRNIALVEELVRIAETAGLSGEAARAALASRAYRFAVDADWQRCRAFEISAVPAHLCAGQRLVGFRPYDDFERLIGKR